jgi:hypothetical protein
MKASMVCPHSGNANSGILFTAFIEPKADASLGGYVLLLFLVYFNLNSNGINFFFFFFGHIHSGAGCAYLVAASHTNLSVFDLLRMELLWSRPAEGANHLVSGVLCCAVLCYAMLCDAMTFFAMTATVD